MSDPGRPGAPVLEPQRGQAGPPRDAGSTAPAGVPLNLSVNLDPVEAAVAFEPTRSLVRTPRSGEHRTPVSDGSPSTLAKVLLEKEARKAAEEQARLAQLREARVEHFKLRTRLLATDKVRTPAHLAPHSAARAPRLTIPSLPPLAAPPPRARTSRPRSCSTGLRARPS